MSTRLQSAGSLEAQVVSQYVWGARPGHRDELILRDTTSTDSDVALIWTGPNGFNYYGAYTEVFKLPDIGQGIGKYSWDTHSQFAAELEYHYSQYLCKMNMLPYTITGNHIFILKTGAVVTPASALANGFAIQDPIKASSTVPIVGKITANSPVTTGLTSTGWFSGPSVFQVANGVQALTLTHWFTVTVNLRSDGTSCCFKFNTINGKAVSTTYA